MIIVIIKTLEMICIRGHKEKADASTRDDEDEKIPKIGHQLHCQERERVISIIFSLNICPKHFTFAWDDDEEAPMDQHHYQERERE